MVFHKKYKVHRSKEPGLAQFSLKSAFDHQTKKNNSIDEEYGRHISSGRKVSDNLTLKSD